MIRNIYLEPEPRINRPPFILGAFLSYGLLIELYSLSLDVRLRLNDDWTLNTQSPPIVRILRTKLDLLDVRVPHIKRNVLFFFRKIASHEKIPFKRACAAIPIQLLSMAILILVID